MMIVDGTAGRQALPEWETIQALLHSLLLLYCERSRSQLIIISRLFTQASKY